MGWYHLCKSAGCVVGANVLRGCDPDGRILGRNTGRPESKVWSHEVINTIMLNFIAIALVSYFTQYHYKALAIPFTKRSDWLRAHIARLGKFIPGLPNVSLNLAFLLALFLVSWSTFLWRTKWGYEIRSTGSNPSAAEYGGISIKKQIILAMVVSGALAGMVGINDVMGYRYRYYDGFSDNYGFTGIAVALLGRNHPVGVILAALLFAVLQHGGIYVDGFSEHVTKDIVQVLQGIIILFVAAEGFFKYVSGRLRLKQSAKV
jgi:simple sugar transport system permease protein